MGLKSVLVYGERPDLSISNMCDNRSILEMPSRLAFDFQDLIDAVNSVNAKIKAYLGFLKETKNSLKETIKKNDSSLNLSTLKE